jgi:hypothetical protein
MVGVQGKRHVSAKAKLLGGLLSSAAIVTMTVMSAGSSYVGGAGVSGAQTAASTTTYPAPQPGVTPPTAQPVPHQDDIASIPLPPPDTATMPIQLTTD